MTALEQIKENIKENVRSILSIELDDFDLDLPPEDKLGDYAFACFELATKSKKKPNDIASQLAKSFVKNELIKEIKNIGPYLNIFVNRHFVKKSLEEIADNKKFGQNKIGKGQKVLIEFSGPNTNKPQHVGHVRNACIGQSLISIFKANGYKTIAVNIINDRGIHIVKSMLAWQEFADGETPETSNMKGDHLVGKYYVKFGQVLKEEQDKYFKKKNIDLAKLPNLERKKAEEEFLNHSQWMKKAHAMLIAWENNDPDVRRLWKMMNDWVYIGYEETYKNLGVEFDHLDFESDTYLLGKQIVGEGLKKNTFYKKDDGSVWIDLTKKGLDEKILLRADGTSVYLTQDLGTAVKRYKKFKFDQGIYVVANEQDYHFKILFLTLEKLGYKWADNLYHLSYGMVSLPGGKIKSREGKTADADDLMATMTDVAKEVMNKAEKKVETSDDQKQNIAKIVGLGALKFFMLSANPQKNIVFKPSESISFDGYTGTFIQYTHARISSILKKSGQIKKIKNLETSHFNTEEKKLVKTILQFPHITLKSAKEYNPSLINQYLFELAKSYNNFYQHHSVLNAEDDNTKQIRLNISLLTQETLAKGLKLLGIEAPEQM
ncbi:arginine--tRNA ligase [Patescibacteria group bacterium]|nr:arginine--tRNA ligase [Patescibacteria group bacterium]